MKVERYLERLMTKLETREGGCLVELFPPKLERGVPLYRSVYLKLRGEVPKNVDLRPTCGNSKCVNPDHRKQVARIKHTDGTKACCRCRIRFKKAERSGSYCAACDRKRDARQAKYYRAQRANEKSETIAALGGECVCCGEREHSFLTIDHVRDDGGEERRQMAVEGWQRSGWRLARRSGYDRARYQLLCMNCNLGKQICGTCPHQRGVGLLSHSGSEDG